MEHTVQSVHDIDKPFFPAYEEYPPKIRTSFLEFGLAGLKPDAPPGAKAAVSAWLPGSQPRKMLTCLHMFQKEKRAFRFLFPELFFAPAREAHKLFTGKHLGLQIHFLAKVRAHPEKLLNPFKWQEKGAWLDEPALNRLPLAIWMQGGVSDIRCLVSQKENVTAVVVLLSHEKPGRQSILEICVTPETTENGKPGIIDRFECTGSDGFITVNGIFQEANYFPRIILHRGAREMIQRDFSRDFNQFFVNAAKEAQKIQRRSSAAYRLSEDYLHACSLICRSMEKAG